ncbi:hypothetical protein WAI453_007659 [Rhynchosporium graminicola]
MTGLAFDHLAKNDTAITFLHSFPGFFRRNIFARQTAPASSGLFWRVTLAALRIFFACLMALLGSSPLESGERQAFLMTNESFGAGVSLISDKCEEAAAPSALLRYRDGLWADKIWDHTLRIFEQIAAQ